MRRPAINNEHKAAFGRKLFLDQFCLSGRVALITGASRGIGKAIALALAEAGADLVIASRKLPDLEVTAQEISQMGRKVLAVPANVRHLSEIENLVRKSTEEFGHIDILVNNAGTNIVYGSVFAIDEAAWDVTMGLNLKGYFFLSQAVGKIMRDRGSGTIINIASASGIRPDVGLGVYCVSKAGVIMLTKVMAQEWGQYNIRVNAIAPGIVRTKLTKEWWTDPEHTKVIEDNTALGRLAEPDEMANAVLFLTSDASSYVTGQTLMLDGGGFASVRNLLKSLR